MGAQKITNLGKLPSEQKGKLPSDENKIKITKESSQVKKENSQSLKIIVEYKLVKVRFPCPTGSHFGRAVSELNIFFCKI